MCGWAAQEEELRILSIVPWLKDPAQVVVVPLREMHKPGSVFTCLSTPRDNNGVLQLHSDLLGSGICNSLIQVASQNCHRSVFSGFLCLPLVQGNPYKYRIFLLLKIINSDLGNAQLLQREWLQFSRPYTERQAGLHLYEKEGWTPFFDQTYSKLSAVDLGNASVPITWGTKLVLTSMKRGTRGTHLTPFSNRKVFCRIDIAYETNTQLELGCFWKHCLYSLPPYSSRTGCLLIPSSERDFSGTQPSLVGD